MTEDQRKEWDLIIDKIPLDGPLNMAVDDYLFQSLTKEPRTYLRFYMWRRPAASIGYSQKIQEVVNVEYCQKQNIDIVRRMTGGKLVLHSNEVTYSLCSSDISTFTSTLVDSYRLISEALINGLEKMTLKPRLAESPPDTYLRGNLPCFSYPAQNEIEIGGNKIIGSAQRRIGANFIQHGSIPLENEQDKLKSISFLKEAEDNVRMISLSQALGKKVSFEWVVDLLKAGFSEYFNIGLKRKRLDENENKAVLQIIKERYGNRDWTYLR
ncbi:biotin/lipoate A/B protein ligase family protein [Acidobacteriota bacterium]